MIQRRETRRIAWLAAMPSCAAPDALHFLATLFPNRESTRVFRPYLISPLGRIPMRLAPGALGLSRNYLSTGVTGEKQNQWDSKLSWNQSSKLSVFARFGLNDVSWSNPQQYGLLGGPGYSAANTAVGNGLGHIYSGTGSATYIFGPNLIADAYYGYTRNNAQAIPEELNQNLGWTLMGIPGLQSSDPREGGLPSLQIDGFGGTGSNIPEATIGPANNFQPQYYGNVEKEWVGNVTWVKGAHNLRVGVDFDQQQDNEDFEEATNCTYCTGSGGFQFSQGSTQLNGGPAGNDYNAFASFLLGLSSNAGKVTLIPPQYQDYQNILGFYARDQWQVNHKLTLTYGTRWDYYPYPNRGSRGLEYLDISTNRDDHLRRGRESEKLRHYQGQSALRAKSRPRLSVPHYDCLSCWICAQHGPDNHRRRPGKSAELSRQRYFDHSFHQQLRLCHNASCGPAPGGNSQLQFRQRARCP